MQHHPAHLPYFEWLDKYLKGQGVNEKFSYWVRYFFFLCVMITIFSAIR